MSEKALEAKRRDALGNTFNAAVFRRLVTHVCKCSGILPCSFPSTVKVLRALPFPKCPSFLDPWRGRIKELAAKYSMLASPFSDFLQQSGLSGLHFWHPETGANSRYELATLLHSQHSIYNSKKGIGQLISGATDPQQH
eukprot:8852619-Karenia_brevis.AAC.1